jgi:hypothetical protein
MNDFSQAPIGYAMDRSAAQRANRVVFFAKFIATAQSP